MKYVLLGTLGVEWASKQAERTAKARAKLDKLGIKIESIHYTQGPYDFVDVVDAPSAEAILAFSVWYAAQGLGRIQTMPAFDSASFENAVKQASG
ncbi:MAG TPA: GYD domain-containing protein [Vineibacter sp.]|nr:GYD domain-containing protein [Vineibacter sp.]